MQFLGIGYQEILLVLGLMLVVLGPERMPTVAYQIGRAVRTLQSYARAVRSEFSEEISYIEDQYKTVRGEVQSTREVLRDEQARFAAEMREATAPIQQSLAEVPQLAGAATPLNVINLPDRSGIDAAPAQSPSESARPRGRRPTRIRVRRRLRLSLPRLSPRRIPLRPCSSKSWPPNRPPRRHPICALSLAIAAARRCRSSTT